MNESGSMFYVPPASEWARWSDALQWYISGWMLFFTVLVFVGVFVFAIKYRRRALGEVPKPVHGSMALEITWTVVPLLIALTMFAGGAALFYNYATPPA